METYNIVNLAEVKNKMGISGNYLTNFDSGNLDSILYKGKRFSALAFKDAIDMFSAENWFQKDQKSGKTKKQRRKILY